MLTGKSENADFKLLWCVLNFCGAISSLGLNFGTFSAIGRSSKIFDESLNELRGSRNLELSHTYTTFLEFEPVPWAAIFAYLFSLYRMVNDHPSIWFIKTGS